MYLHRMDSIANHYAARRKVSGNQSPHKRTRTESADAVSTLSRTSGNTAAANTGASNSVQRQASCPALSLPSIASSIGINQQGRYAPIIPPRPKQAKTSAQQAEDRERIRRLQHGSSSSAANAAQRRAGRASVSPRKALSNPSTRKLIRLTI